MSEQLTCGLCGVESHGVAWGRPVEWTNAYRREHPDALTWETVNRCLDYQACRRRLEDSNKPWPVRDVITRPTMKPSRELEEVPF
jgi:hypothetical protein